MYSAAIIKVEKTIVSYILYPANNLYPILFYPIPYTIYVQEL